MRLRSSKISSQITNCFQDGSFLLKSAILFQLLKIKLPDYHLVHTSIPNMPEAKPRQSRGFPKRSLIYSLSAFAKIISGVFTIRYFHSRQATLLILLLISFHFIYCYIKCLCEHKALVYMPLQMHPSSHSYIAPIWAKEANCMKVSSICSLMDF